MTRGLRKLWRGLDRDRGAFTLSYVLVVPVFLLGIMTIVQASVWYLAREAALAAARHGADVARTSKPPPGAGAAAALAFARSAAPGFLTRVSATARGSTATTVRITVSGQAPSLVPWTVIKITEVVTAPVERFVASGDRPAVVRPALPARRAPAPWLPAGVLP